MRKKEAAARLCFFPSPNGRHWQSVNLSLFVTLVNAAVFAGLLASVIFTPRYEPFIERSSWLVEPQRRDNSPTVDCAGFKSKLDENQNAERAEFYKNGYIGPMKLYTKAQVQQYWQQITSDGDDPCLITIPTNSTNNWVKGCFLKSKALWKLASRPEILNTVRKLIGDDVVLWGGEALTRKGHIHSKWHTDVITAPCRRSASVWIGAENINKKTILKVIRNSHDLGVTVQALVPPPVAQEYQSGETDTFKEEGEKLLGYAKTFYETADIVESEMVEGDVLIFQGSTWHGAINPTDFPRKTILLQYVTPKCAVKFLYKFNPPVSYHPYLPPVTLVSGDFDSLSAADKARNNYVWPHESNREKPEYVYEGDNVAMQRLQQAQKKNTRGNNVVFETIVQASSANMALVEYETLTNIGSSELERFESHFYEEILYVHHGSIRYKIVQDDNDGLSLMLDVAAGGVIYFPSKVYRSVLVSPTTSTKYTRIRFNSQAAYLEVQKTLSGTRIVAEDPGVAKDNIFLAAKPAGVFMQLQRASGHQFLKGEIVTLSAGDTWEAPSIAAGDVVGIVTKGTVVVHHIDRKMRDMGELFWLPSGFKNVSFLNESPEVVQLMIFEFQPLGSEQKFD